MKINHQILFLPIKNSTYNCMRLLGIISQKENYHRTGARSFRRLLPYRQSCTNKSRNLDYILKPDIIPEKPTSPVKFGLIKVLSIFILGANIGGYLFKQCVRLIEDYELLTKDGKT